jgi:hypothetical protein
VTPLLVRGPTGHRVSGAVVIGFGVAAVAAGLSMAGAYVYEALRVLDEADRSWLFWGLAMLFIGIILARLGVGLVLLGRRLMRPATMVDPPLNRPGAGE